MEAVIFCGIQATGKSSFYKAHFFNSHVRISYDQLKTRHREKLFLDICLKTQQPFVLDNTNPSIAIRHSYIALAKQHQFKIIGYYFQSKISDALMRNFNRVGKENIPEIGIKGTFNQLEIPSFNEGFDELFYVYIDENNQFQVEEWQLKEDKDEI